MNSTNSTFGSEPEYHWNDDDLKRLQKTGTDDEYFLPVVITYSVTFLVGVSGNSLVIFAILGHRGSRTATNSFLVSLAFADLLLLLVSIPNEIARYFVVHWRVGSAMCKIAHYTEMVSATTSILNLSAVSIERYIVVVHPLKARSLCTMGNISRVIIIVWIVSLIASIPQIFTVDIYTLEFQNANNWLFVPRCTDIHMPLNVIKGFALYKLSLMFIIPTLLMFYCYCKVIRVLWISSSGMSAEQCSEMTSMVVTSNSRIQIIHHGEIMKARKEVIQVLITIIILFLICWGPRLILTMVIKFRALPEEAFKSHHILRLKVAFDLLPYVQSSLNPIIYGFMSRNFRRSLGLAFRENCSRESPVIPATCSSHFTLPMQQMRAPLMRQALDSTAETPP